MPPHGMGRRTKETPEWCIGNLIYCFWKAVSRPGILHEPTLMRQHTEACATSQLCQHIFTVYLKEENEEDCFPLTFCAP